MKAKGERMQYDAALKRYSEKMSKWEESYPADASKFIKSRLQQVLSATAGIYYNAELVEKNNKKYFVNPEYEKKPLH